MDYVGKPATLVTYDAKNLHETRSLYTWISIHVKQFPQWEVRYYSSFPGYNMEACIHSRSS